MFRVYCTFRFSVWLYFISYCCCFRVTCLRIFVASLINVVNVLFSPTEDEAADVSEPRASNIV